ncbi:hypothetical protein [Phaeobacter sp. C3_T13_0]|uniref:hypothetical protein n=1 Tax=Phaeobacter cretensis TaxID=3342641 RepID=UPI0039BC589F
MDTIKTAEYARALYAAHGEKAEVEVAQKMRRCQETGKIAEAANWKSVRQMIFSLRGPSQS